MLDTYGFSLLIRFITNYIFCNNTNHLKKLDFIRIYFQLIHRRVHIRV
jgi:hypothetical protein